MDGLVYLGMPIEGFEPFTINPFGQKYPSSSSGSPPIRALFACRGGLSPGPERQPDSPPRAPVASLHRALPGEVVQLHTAGESSSEQFAKCLWLWLEVRRDRPHIGSCRQGWADLSSTTVGRSWQHTSQNKFLCLTLKKNKGKMASQCISLILPHYTFQFKDTSALVSYICFLLLVDERGWLRVSWKVIYPLCFLGT